MLESPRQLCGRCGGPGVRDLVPLAGFVAAVDVWDARGRERIEQWQQAAFQRLLAATAAARAQSLEPDITLSARIVEALAADAPDESGSVAYALLIGPPWNGHQERFEALPGPQREAARVLVRNRLATLEAVLPAQQRPLPLPKGAEPQVLRERYRQLSERLDSTVPQLDRLLFTLPGARG